VDALRQKSPGQHATVAHEAETPPHVVTASVVSAEVGSSSGALEHAGRTTSASEARNTRTIFMGWLLGVVFTRIDAEDIRLFIVARGAEA
jgi:hypothetical protein